MKVFYAIVFSAGDEIQDASIYTFSNEERMNEAVDHICGTNDLSLVIKTGSTEIDKLYHSVTF